MTSLEKKILEPYMRNGKMGATTRYNSPKTTQKQRLNGFRLQNIEGGSSLNFDRSFLSHHESSTITNTDTLPPVKGSDGRALLISASQTLNTGGVKSLRSYSSSNLQQR